MTGGGLLDCPSCRRTLRAPDWYDSRSGCCGRCRTDFEAVIFPALTRVRAVAKPQAVLVADDSTCFFHVDNQAEKVCDTCGRFLCAVCAVPFSGATICPTCLAARKTKSPDIIPSRTLFEGVALALAVVPALVFPVTIVTAPLALGTVIYGWKKPSSLVSGRRRWKLVLAAVIASAEITGWLFVFGRTWLR